MIAGLGWLVVVRWSLNVCVARWYVLVGPCSLAVVCWPLLRVCVVVGVLC